MRRKRFILIPIVLIFIFSLSGCFTIQIKKDVAYPAQAFERAWKEIEKIHLRNPERKGKPHIMNILVYDGSSREMVKVSVSMWIVNLGLESGLKYAEFDMKQHCSEHFNFDWRALKDLRKIGPGLLVQVEDENDYVLIWLK
ncbi:MAG: hypothetical protein ACE5WD_03305 [Candidatus Aminicenantia bacterium]